MEGEKKMAKLKSLKMRKDDGERQIKCLIVEDVATGDVIKCFNPSEFPTIIANTDKNYLTKVYSATVEDKQKMLETIKDNIVVEEDSVNVNLTEEDLIMQLFVMFTDLEIDLKDKKLIKEVVANPNDVFVAVKIEIDKILMSVVETFIATQRTLQSNPHATEMIVKDIVSEDDEKAKKEAEIAELQARLKELGVK